MYILNFVHCACIKKNNYAFKKKQANNLYVNILEIKHSRQSGLTERLSGPQFPYLQKCGRSRPLSPRPALRKGRLYSRLNVHSSLSALPDESSETGQDLQPFLPRRAVNLKPTRCGIFRKASRLCAHNNKPCSVNACLPTSCPSLTHAVQVLKALQRNRLRFKDSPAVYG